MKRRTLMRNNFTGRATAFALAALVGLGGCQKKNTSAASPATPTTSERKLFFSPTPMRADVHSPVPAKDEMGMDYLPVYADEQTSSPVQGQGNVTLTPADERRIGITTSR